MKQTRTILACAALCGLFALTGCKSDQEMNQTNTSGASMGVINNTCPIMGSPVKADTADYATYKGHKVGFCCAGCDGKWEQMSDAERDAFVAKFVK